MRPPVSMLLAFGVAACGGGQESSTDAGAGEPDPSTAESPAYPRDDVLRVNQIQAKGSHNSYHLASEHASIPDWQFSRAPLDVQLSEQGARAIELDTNFDAKSGEVFVRHIPGVDDQSTCKTLAKCLAVVLGWSSRFPNHHVLFVQIEPKEDEFPEKPDWSAYADAVDAVIEKAWPRDRRITPDDVRGAAKNVREAVTTKGWPTLGESRGKAIFFLDDTDGFRDAYVKGAKKDADGLDGRPMFVDGDEKEPYAAFLVRNDPVGDPIETLVRDGFMVRTRADVFPEPGDYEKTRTAALASGAQVLTTDYPVASDGVSAFDIPGGDPSRCNPVTAPAKCAAKDVEDPATFLVE